MSVQWKGDKPYEAFRNPGSRQLIWKRLNASTQKEAEEEARINEGDRLRRRRDKTPNDQPQDIPWSELKDRYLNAGEGDQNASSTLARKRSHFKHIDLMVSVDVAADWTFERFEEYKRRCSKTKAAPGVINKELGIIKAALRLARRLKYKTPSADDLREVKQVRNRPPMPVYYPSEDQAKILSIASPFWAVATLLGGKAGLRRSEVLSLRWQDVSFGKRELRVADRADWREKTRKSKTIPIHVDLLSALTEWRAANPGGTLILPWDKDPNEFTKAFKRLCRRAGLATGSFKSLRHGFATELMQLDVNAMKVQRVMGHDSILTTQTYSHVHAADLHQAINSLPSSLAPSNHLLTKGDISTNPEHDRATSTSTGEAAHG